MNKQEKRLSSDFFRRDALIVAHELIGKCLIRQFEDGRIQKHIITEVEAYCGTDDLACHASKGRTPRTEVMYDNGGVVYMYLIYGMYWMLNFVTGIANEPQAVLIRGVAGIVGPGRVAKSLELDKSFYGEDLSFSKRLWVENAPIISFDKITTTARIGVDYAGDWKHKPWRFLFTENK